MARVEAGRHTDGHQQELVVFLIGMRVNRWWAVRSWWPVLMAMPGMLRELERDPAAGMLGRRMLIGSGGPLVVQYWRDTEALVRYAHDTSGQHRPAWRAFNLRARQSRGAVGIWHETYAVPARAHESVYVDVPVTGLAAATSLVPVGRRGDSATQRLGSARPQGWVCGDGVTGRAEPRSVSSGRGAGPRSAGWPWTRQHPRAGVRAVG